eukprot:CAMPEP_0202059036 /NCGR_PEP_ID=MMETSP0963-20130614/33940_1 /ASSEMBLY_ACC=CAM_ASM_000494 /TAXON_ID=4773 /ORGANISM="Schizochytrium aggregatum, Strain ATCC28209" /LENGTH=103 /DNA_ID=CAMNT_0048625053 /DNA_START=177 /DNA_END=488 /DNA_ORIENTATION=-
MVHSNAGLLEKNLENFHLVPKRVSACAHEGHRRKALKACMHRANSSVGGLEVFAPLTVIAKVLEPEPVHVPGAQERLVHGRHGGDGVFRQQHGGVSEVKRNSC